jgi:hypothetical protein
MTRNVVNVLVLVVLVLSIYTLLDEFFKRSNKKEHISPNTRCLSRYQQLYENNIGSEDAVEAELCGVNELAPQFSKFIWVVSDGWPRVFADDLFASYKDHGVRFHNILSRQ